MAGPSRLALKVEGLRRLRQLTQPPTLVASPLHDAMEAIGLIGLMAAKRAAPQGPSSTGHAGGLTAARFQVRLQAKPIPLWVKVETTATRKWPGHGNYAYTKRVEWDPKLHHAGWLRKTFVQLRSRFDSALGTAAHAIEADWS